MKRIPMQAHSSVWTDLNHPEVLLHSVARNFHSFGASPGPSTWLSFIVLSLRTHCAASQHTIPLTGNSSLALRISPFGAPCSLSAVFCFLPLFNKGISSQLLALASSTLLYCSSSKIYLAQLLLGYLLFILRGITIPLPKTIQCLSMGLMLG